MKTSTQRSPNVPQRKDRIPSDINFPVVGIGASAGGLQAVKAFFQHMPADNGMAFVVILHLSPDHQSMADKIIQDMTRMPVRQATETVAIEHNHIYVIAPGQDLCMNDSYLSVKPTQRSGGSHIAIDLFFRDLADVHKERAFCVVLSGTGADGAVGLSRIKEQGGVTLAQAPEDAEFDSMPRAAIETRMVDLVLPVVEMPQKLLELWRNAQSITLPPTSDPDIKAKTPVTGREAVAAEQVLRDILVLLRTGTGHDFKHYKRATILRRIERRLQVTAQPDLIAYHAYLQDHPDETRALLGDMLIGVTNFFRDREAFEALERDAIPGLVQATLGPTASREEIRIWSAGCSTGEEAYSLAMLVQEQMTLDDSHAKLQVFATDIDERAIATGRAGLYPESIVTDVPPTRLRQHFSKESQHYRVRKDIRESVLFAKHSLLADPPFSQLDLIVCRNLLIYLDRDVQRDILQMFHFALRPGGYLFLGSSESADSCPQLFTPVDKRNRIFRMRAGSTVIRQAPVLPRGGYSKVTTVSRPPLLAAVKRASFADIHLRAIASAAPPSMIVDEQANILYMTEGTTPYLRHIAGEMSRDLLALIHPDLRLEARTALFQSSQSGAAVTSQWVKTTRDKKPLLVNLTVQPFTDDVTGNEHLLVIFNEQPDNAQALPANATPTEQQMLINLEKELQRNKLQLQQTLEQSEVSSEELKASNEEMQAVNEELRSASEELETSKEELQSVNEELLTVNYELKIKVEETDKVNDYLTNLIASTDIATVFIDRSLRIRWFTPRATEIFNMLPVDNGRSLLDITHRLDYPQMAEDAGAVFESLAMIEREVSSKDQHWYIARLLPYRSSENHINGTVLTFIDITKRRAAEDELRLSEERMRLVTQSTHDFAIILLDSHGVITDWNTGAQIIFGFSKDDVLGKYYDFIFTREDRAQGVPELELRNAREQGRSDDERWHERKDGSRFYCSGEVTLLEGESQHGYVKIARDLTEFKRLHDEQNQRLTETQTNSHLKDEFFAVMSHELKHPLNLIQLNAELLRRMPLAKSSDRAFKAVNTICEAVASQARIINDLLDVARVRTGKLKLRKEPVDLVRLVEEIHAVVANDYRSHNVILSVPPATEPPVIVLADATRLEQVIWNLVSNALKFTPANGTVQLVVQRSDEQARLDIIDNGMGIAKEHQDAVFDLFRQATNHHAEHQREGLGIGLSLVRQLVEAHKGTVQVHSSGLGLGSTFTILLPLAQQKLAVADNASAGSVGRLRGIKVLLVDDSKEVLEVLQLLLEMEDAQIESFSDPVEALAAAQRDEYDLIISDIGMPHMNGHELILALRKVPHLRDTPAIALTGYGANADQKRSRQSGFNKHVSKPVTHEALIAAIETLIAAH